MNVFTKKEDDIVYLNVGKYVSTYYVSDLYRKLG